MLLPIKPNRTVSDPRRIQSTSLSDETFSRVVSTLRGQRTWKTTYVGRHSGADKALTRMLANMDPARVLDVGASDGSTSIDLIRQLSGRVREYIVTDTSFSIPIRRRGRCVFFYDPTTGRCTMCAMPFVLVYADEGRSIVHRLAARMISSAPPYKTDACEFVSTVHPRLQRLAAHDERIRIRQWDAQYAWQGHRMDVVKIANVLNRSYFSDDQLSRMIINASSALKPTGLFVVVENRNAHEQWSIYVRDYDRLVHVESAGGGSDIHDLIEAARIL